MNRRLIAVSGPGNEGYQVKLGRLCLTVFQMELGSGLCVFICVTTELAHISLLC